MTKMIQLPVGSPNQQLPDVKDKESCSGVPFSTTNPQATSTPTCKAPELQTGGQETPDDLVHHTKNRRTSTRRLRGYCGGSVASSSTCSSSVASCLSSVSSTSLSSALNLLSSSDTEACTAGSSVFKVPSTSEPSDSKIICRLPLNRLESILDALDIVKRCTGSASDGFPASIDTVSGKSVAPKKTASSTLEPPHLHKSAMQNQNEYGPLYKLICLYCERTFSNQKLMFKHTDRVHKISKDRRSSSRVGSAVNIVDVSLYCIFCNKSRTLKPSSEDLPLLFKHLVAAHSDRYYACEACVLRFPCEEAREAHMEAIHPAVHGARPKSKAALKAFTCTRSDTNHHLLHNSSLNESKATSKKNVSTSMSSKSLNEVEVDLAATNKYPANNDDENERDSQPDSECQSTNGQAVRLRSSPRNSMAQPTTSDSRDESKSNKKTIVFKKSERLLMRNAEPMLLSRLGIAQHRLPRQSRRLLAIASSSSSSSSSTRGDASSSLSSSSSSSSSSASSSSSSSSSSASSSALALSLPTASVSSALFSTSIGATGKIGARKKNIAMSSVDAEELQQTENCYNKLSKLKAIRGTMKNYGISSNNTDTVRDVDSANQTINSNNSRGKGHDGLPNSATSPLMTASGTSFAQGSTNGPSGRIAAGSSTGSTTSNNGSSTSAIISLAGGSNSTGTVGNSGSTGLFDEDFYETVTRNVAINLSCYLDGKLHARASSVVSPVSDAPIEPTVRSTIVRSPLVTDSKIYEATNLPATGLMFPTLLTVEQYGTDAVAGLVPMTTSAVKAKKPITKNSWKWKWDFVKKYKYVNENGRVVKKIKQPTLGLRDLSKLDMWTQLTMRMKHEMVRNQSLASVCRKAQTHVNVDHVDSITAMNLSSRQDKQAMVDQLNQILDARLLPQIDLEQNDQRIIKEETSDEQSLQETENTASEKSELNCVLTDNMTSDSASSVLPSIRTSPEQDFLERLQLIKLVQHSNLLPVVLSGEWARPRCYVCYGCGDKFKSLKQVEEHRIFRHPHVYSTFYEIVGRELIEKKLYKHFFIPFAALATHRLHYLRLSEAAAGIVDSGVVDAEDNYCMNMEIKNEDSSSNEATSISTTTSALMATSSRYSIFSTTDVSADSVRSLTSSYQIPVAEEDGESRPVVCSKCQKDCPNMLLLYAHMLHCSNDYVWLQAKKRMKYRRARRRRGGNRHASGSGNALCGAASLLATVRKAQQHQLQNAVEKAETASTTSTSSSKGETSSACSDVTNSSNASTQISTVDGNNTTGLSDSKKKSKSPKPKDSDSDIVKRLLANLPAKRNSRQILQTTKQINKRSNVKGRNPLNASSMKAPKKVAVKRRHTMGAPVATRLKGAKEVKKRKSNLLLTATASNGNVSNASETHHSSPPATTSSCTFVSTKNLRSKSRENSISPPREGSRKKQVGDDVVDGTRKTLTNKQIRDAKEGKHFAPKSRQGKLKQKMKSKENVDRVKKILQWKKNNIKLRRIVTNGKRVLRSGRLQDVSIAGRKLKMASKKVIACKSRVSSKKATTSASVVSGSALGNRASSSVSSSVAQVTKNIAKVDDVDCFESKGEVAPEDDKCHMALDDGDINDATENQDTSIGKDEHSVAESQDIRKEVTIEQVNDQQKQEGSSHISDRAMMNCATKRRLSKGTTSAVESPISVDTIEVCNQPKLCVQTQEDTASEKVTQVSSEHLTHVSSSSAPVESVPDRIETSTTDIVALSASLSSNSSNISRLPLDSSSQSPVNKRKPKKLNDCIAMLTGKLSERLGVDFFNSQLQRKHSSEETKKTSQIVLENYSMKTALNDPDLSQATVPTRTQLPPKQALRVPPETSSLCSSYQAAVAEPTHNIPTPTMLSVPTPAITTVPLKSTEMLAAQLKLDSHQKSQTKPIPMGLNLTCEKSSEARLLLAGQSVIIPVKHVAVPQTEENVPDEPLNLSKTGSASQHHRYQSNLLQTNLLLHNQTQNQIQQLQQQQNPEYLQKNQPHGQQPKLPQHHSEHQQHRHLPQPPHLEKAQQKQRQQPQQQQHNHHHHYHPGYPEKQSQLQQHQYHLQESPSPEHFQHHHSHRQQPTSNHQQEFPHVRMNTTAKDQSHSNASSCTITPKPGSGNLSSIKLPPGLIIERVEYKQSRPIISKEAPSVTIVARQRQAPLHSTPSDVATDIRKTGSTRPMSSNAAGITSAPYAHSMPVLDSQQQVSQMQHYCSNREPSRKIFDGCSTFNGNPASATVDQMATNLRMQPVEKPTQTVVPFVENRISVTITEAKPPESSLQEARVRPKNNSLSNSCSLSPQTQPLKAQQTDRVVPSFCSNKTQQCASSSSVLLPLQQAVSKQPIFCQQQQLPQSSSNALPTAEKVQPTTLIIPHVPMPQSVSKAATKRSNRKSVFAAVPPSTENAAESVVVRDGKNTSANNSADALRTILTPTASSFPTSADSLCRANMLASMSFSLLSPGLLGASSMGLDLQRLAAVGLPAHLKPPIIPPLTVPAAANASPVALLEKILHPTRTEALTNALELSLKGAQLLPSDIVPLKEAPVPVLGHQHGDGGSSGQPHRESSSDSVATHMESNCTPHNTMSAGSLPGVIQKEETRSTHQVSGKSKRSSSKRSSLDDYQRKTLMEQIWNASIVDAMMEKDARAEESRTMEKVTLQPKITQSMKNDESGAESLHRSRNDHGEGFSNVPVVSTAHINTNDKLADASEEGELLSQCANATPNQRNNIKPGIQELSQPVQKEKRQSQMENEEKQKDQENHSHVESVSQDGSVPEPSPIPPDVERNRDGAGDDNSTKETPVTAADSAKHGLHEPTCTNAPITNEKWSEEESRAKKGEELSSNECSAAIRTTQNDEDASKVQGTFEREDVASKDNVTPTPKTVRKRRKNELASILSDQLLESFKEVDKSRLNDLKLLHDITCETPDVKFTLEQIPQLAKRKSNPRMPELVAQFIPAESSRAPANCASAKKSSSKKVTKEANVLTEKPMQCETNKVTGVLETAGERKASSKPQSEQQDSTSEAKLTNEMMLDNQKDKNKGSEDMAGTKQLPVFLPTRRTRKLSIDIERLRPMANKAERVSQKKLSHKMEGLDMALPNMKNNTGDKTLKLKDGKMEQYVTKEEEDAADMRLVTSSNGEKQRSKSLVQVKKKTNTEPAASKAAESTPKKESNNNATTVEGKQQATTTDKVGKNLKRKYEKQAVAATLDAEGLAPNPSGSMVCASLEAQSTGSAVAALPKNKASTLRERRKSVYVDRDMAKYVNRDEDWGEGLHSTSTSCKDDLILASRRGMRSQAKAVDLGKIDTFVPATMNPRDPRRRVIRNRIEEERAAAANQQQNEDNTSNVSIVNKEKQKQTSETTPGPAVEDKDKTKSSQNSVSQTTKLDKSLTLRRISTRRTSVFVRSPTPPPPSTLPVGADLAEQKVQISDAGRKKEDESMRNIGNETKRIYQRRASIYKVPVDLLREDADRSEAREPEAKNTQSTAYNRRSKTPGPGDWNRRNQLNGNPGPTIESLLLSANDSDSSLSGNAQKAPKRRTTKNSQIAETVSKLFNIQEEIMLIDSTRRKPRKPTSALSSSVVPTLPHEKQKLEEIVNIDESSKSKETAPEECVAMGASPVTSQAENSASGSNVAEIGTLAQTYNRLLECSTVPPLPPPPPPPPPPRKSISFSNDEDDSPKALNELVENILKTARESDTSNDSEDDNISLACFVAQKNTQDLQRHQSMLGNSKLEGDTLADVYIPVRAMSVADDESTTNTDAMDDDLMSVTTEVAPSSSSLYGGRGRRRRRQSVRGSKLKRQQAKEKALARAEAKDIVTYNCDLCRKTFKKQDAYNKHRMTLTHIAKLSEQEYILSQQKQEQQRQLSTVQCQSHEDSQSDGRRQTFLVCEDQEVPRSISSPQSEEACPSEKLNQHGSSPAPQTFPQPENKSASPVLGQKDLDKQSLKALSQEEKLFYECCSMLKESNTSEGDPISLTVSLKTNEHGNVTAIPPVIMPVEGGDKLMDMDYALSLHHQPPPYVGGEGHDSVQLPVEMASKSTFGKICHEEEDIRRENTSFRALLDVSSDATSDTQHRTADTTMGIGRAHVVENYADVSPQHSMKSFPIGSSCNAKIKTKGALKGYDNFKVSIPMTGLIMSPGSGVTSLDSGNVGSDVDVTVKESRLDTLADVALCGDIPNEFGVLEQFESNSEGIINSDATVSIPPALQCNNTSSADLNLSPQKTERVGIAMVVGEKGTDIHASDVEMKRYPQAIPASVSQAFAVDPGPEPGTIVTNNEAKLRGTSANKSPTVGRSIMCRKRKKTDLKQIRPTPKGSLAVESAKGPEITSLDDDVYAFQDSASDDAVPVTYTSKKTTVSVDVPSAAREESTKQQQKAQRLQKQQQQQQARPQQHDGVVAQGSLTETPERDDVDDSQVSSLSFSDRDDFVYGTNTMSDEDEEEEEEEEGGKSSSNSSGQTTPKKKLKADVQKKSLIMGRIFKKGGSKKEKRESNDVATKPTELVSSMNSSAWLADPNASVSRKTAVKDFDKLFDTLKNASPEAEGNSDTKGIPALDKPYSGSSEKVSNGMLTNLEHHAKDDSYTAGPPCRLRRRASVHQKKLTETWDSDEYEDFHDDDIMGLIDRDASDKNEEKALSQTTVGGDSNDESKNSSNCIPYIVGLSLKTNIKRTKDDQIGGFDEHHCKEMTMKPGMPLIEHKQQLDVVVTDDTIRKVMESVILETMGKSNSQPSAKSHKLSNKGSRSATTASGNNGANTSVGKEDAIPMAEVLSSLNDHVLESGVVISSQTITTKFKQKLNNLTMSSNHHSMENTPDSRKGKTSSPEKISDSPSLLADTDTPSESLGISSLTNNNNNIANNNNNHSNKNNSNRVKQSAAVKSSKLEISKTRPMVKSRTSKEGMSVAPKNPGRGRPPLAMTAACTASKQRKSGQRKMKNVAYDPDSDYEHSIKYKKVKRKLLEHDIEANLKIEQLQSTLNSDSSILLPTPRRKRNAGDMLYYWSSSSDDEQAASSGDSDGSSKARAEKAERRSRLRMNKKSSTPVGGKQGRQTQRIKELKSIDDLFLSDSAKDEEGGSVAEGLGDFGALQKQPFVVLNQSAERQPSDVSSSLVVVEIAPGTEKRFKAPNGGKSKSHSTKLSNIFEDKPLASVDEAKNAGSNKRGRGRKQQPHHVLSQGKLTPGDDAAADTSSNSENLQQHGWIVGDSHKKLVTLLAHAKGKQDSRKATNHRRK